MAHLVANAVVGRRLWRSACFERSQKVAQTILMFLVPGAFVLVRLALRDPTLERAGEMPADPTASNGPGYIAEDVAGYAHRHGGDGHGF